MRTLPNFFLLLLFALLAMTVKAQSVQADLPTVCLIGGTPSSAAILDEIPADLKAKYRFISFNRPGYGNTPNKSWNEEDLYALAAEAGLKKGAFAVMGISGGGPLAILLADHFGTAHCGVISGMVPAAEYFAFADSTFTKPLMQSAAGGFDSFQKTIGAFPHVEEILKQAASPVPVAIRACYDDLHFILTGIRFPARIFQTRTVDWVHGEDDKNVAIESAQLFLKRFKKAKLTVLPHAGHEIDARVLIRNLLDGWAAAKSKTR